MLGRGIDAADDWIEEHIGEGDIVVTADIPLAARCLKKGAAAIAPKGRVFTEDGIGDALASRDIMADLRDQGLITKGPSPFQPRDRSRYLHQLDEQIRALLRRR